MPATPEGAAAGLPAGGEGATLDRPVLVMKVPLAATALLLLAASAAYVVVRERVLCFAAADRVRVLKGVPDLSGLDFDRERRLLVGVTDEGELVELSLDGKVRSSVQLDDADFEELALDRGGAGIWVLVESESRLVLLGRDGRREGTAIPLPPIGKPTRNRGYEAFAWLPDGRLVVGSEDHPAAFAVRETDGKFGPARVLGSASLSGLLAADDGRRLLLVSRDRGLAVAEVDGFLRTPWRMIAHEHVEAAVIVPGVGLVLASDARPSRLLVYEGLETFDQVEEFCRGR